MFSNLENKTAVKETVIYKIIKAVIFVSFLLFITRLLIFRFHFNDTQSDFKTTNTSQINNGIIEPHSTKNFKTVIQNITKQACRKSHIMLLVFEEMCNDLRGTRRSCSPADLFNKNHHNHPKAPRKKLINSEPAAVINYVVGGLLMVSLGAAFIELYKAKKQVPRNNGKCPLSRKSSLAELTVMKHQRKELIRRESIMEVSEENPHSLGRKVCRPPLRLDEIKI